MEVQKRALGGEASVNNQPEKKKQRAYTSRSAQSGEELCYGSSKWMEPAADTGRRRSTARAFSRWRATAKACRSWSVPALAAKPTRAACSQPSLRHVARAVPSRRHMPRGLKGWIADTLALTKLLRIVVRTFPVFIGGCSCTPTTSRGREDRLTDPRMPLPGPRRQVHAHPRREGKRQQGAFARSLPAHIHSRSAPLVLQEASRVFQPHGSTPPRWPEPPRRRAGGCHAWSSHRRKGKPGNDPQTGQRPHRTKGNSRQYLQREHEGAVGGGFGKRQVPGGGQERLKAGQKAKPRTRLLRSWRWAPWEESGAETSSWARWAVY